MGGSFLLSMVDLTHSYVAYPEAALWRHLAVVRAGEVADAVPAFSNLPWRSTDGGVGTPEGSDGGTLW